MQPPNILVSVLDWGLGHATRCIPIIKSLQLSGTVVTIACTPALKNIFEKEFTDVHFLPLPGYKIKYSKHKNLFAFSLLTQMPRLFWVLKKEKSWLKKICIQYKFDAVISDNRFGFYHKNIPSVYITHQLYIETGNKILNHWAQKIHYYFINKFSECWVPDAAQTPGLAGKLSHPEKLPKIPLHYLGIYSRFNKMELPKNIDYLFILSGPEPQRSIFENLILKQVTQFAECKIVLVRGVPIGNEIKNTAENLLVHNHLPAADLAHLIQSAKQVVCRSGYTSLLDLVSLNKSAYLIPTPGQTEQIYLAKYLNGKNGFSFDRQEDFSLQNILKEKESASSDEIKAVSKLDEVVKDFIARLKG